MATSSTTFTLPRPPDPDWMPDRADREHLLLTDTLERAIRAIVTDASGISPAERSVIVADALAALELDGLGWCERCQSAPEGLCHDHVQGSGLVDAFRRHAYRRLPGRPLIEIDL